MTARSMAGRREERMGDMPNVIYIASDQSGDDAMVFETEDSLDSCTDLLRKRFNVKYICADSVPQLTNEQRQWLELVELAREAGILRVKLYPGGTKNPVVIDGKINFCGSYADAIAELRSYLKPQKPSAERLIEHLRAYIEKDSDWEKTYKLLSQDLADWDAATEAEGGDD